MLRLATAVCLGSLILSPAVQAQCSNPPVVEVVGTGSPGTPGVPALTSPPAVVGLGYSMSVSGGLANANGALLLGWSVQPIFLFGWQATLYPELPVFGLLNFRLDGAGNSPPLLRFGEMPFEYCGLQFVGQSIILDPAAVGSIAFSNAVRVVIGSNRAPVLDPIVSPTTNLQATIAGIGLRPSDKIIVEGGAARVETTVGSDSRFSAIVALLPNQLNRLYVTEELLTNLLSAPATADVIHDTEAPELIIDFPTAGATVSTVATNVSGRVADRLSGFMGLDVTVNGVRAIVNRGIGTNGTFDAAGIPLNVGANTITAVATDGLGNRSAPQIITVNLEPPTGARMVATSGNGQTGTIEGDLANPIDVRVTKADNSPFAGKVVTFSVTRSNGRLRAPNSSSPGSIMYQAITDGSGMARAVWTLGSDAGCGNNRVAVTSKDISGVVSFCASANAKPPTQILIASGDNQIARVDGMTAEKLRVWVNDGCNGVKDVPVRFTVTSGSGGLVSGLNQNLSRFTVLSSVTGHAEVGFRLGSTPGNYTVDADFPGITAAAGFTIFGLAATAGSTDFAAVVLDNSGQPIKDATCKLVLGGASPITAISNADGQFGFTALSASGLADLVVDGSTATEVGGIPINPLNLRFPELHFEFFVFENAANVMPSPVLLPRLKPVNDVVFDTTQDVELTVAGITGLKIVVPKTTTVTHPTLGVASPANPITLALNQVAADDVPMPMPDGAAPPFAWTLQPGGTTFVPPVQIVYPNGAALPAGAITYFLSFDHDAMAFKIVATGHVLADGSASVSDPGSGISKAGWGGVCPPYPAPIDVSDCRVTIAGASCVCTDATTTLTATGSPLPGSYRWTRTQGTAANIMSGATSATVTIAAGSVASTSKDDIEFEVTFTPIDGEPCTARYKLTVVKIDSVTAVGATEIPPKGDANIDHFVTPKGSGDVELTANVAPNDPAIVDKISWVAATQDAVDKNKAKVSRSATAKHEVKVQIGGRECKNLRVWVIWAAIASGTPSTSSSDTGTHLVVQTSLSFTHTIAPAEVCTDADRPDLEGAKTADPPGGMHWTGRFLKDGADRKWDNSRQMRTTVLNPDGVSYDDLCAGVPPPCKEFYDAQPIVYPSDVVEGNDDGGTGDETNDPYANPAELNGFDRPSSPYNHSAGANGNTLECRLHFREFTRVELAGVWTRISGDYLWRFHAKIKKVSGKWVDDGSSAALDNNGF